MLPVLGALVWVFVYYTAKNKVNDTMEKVRRAKEEKGPTASDVLNDQATDATQV